MPARDQLSPGEIASADAVDRSPRVWLFVVVIGALALVAVASAANPLSMPLRAGHADHRELLKTVTAIAAVGVLAALTFTMALHRTVMARRAGQVPLRHTLLRALPVAAAAIAIFALLTIARLQLHTEQTRDVVTVIIGSGSRPPVPFGIRDRRAPPVVAGDDERAAADTLFVEAQPRARERPPYVRMLLAAMALALLLARLASWGRSRQARRSALSEDTVAGAAEDAAVHSALVVTIDAMLDDPDPNTAIIGAYARLTEHLAACELGRLDHEGPMEHLRRVLTRVNVRPEPLRQLIQLFELARFSTHRLTSSHREQALSALHTVAADIAMLAPPQALSASTGAMR